MNHFRMKILRGDLAESMYEKMSNYKENFLGKMLIWVKFSKDNKQFLQFRKNIL